LGIGDPLNASFLETLNKIFDGLVDLLRFFGKNHMGAAGYNQGLGLGHVGRHIMGILGRCHHILVSAQGQGGNLFDKKLLFDGKSIKNFTPIGTFDFKP